MLRQTASQQKYLRWVSLLQREQYSAAFWEGIKFGCWGVLLKAALLSYGTQALYSKSSSEQHQSFDRTTDTDWPPKTSLLANFAVLHLMYHLARKCCAYMNRPGVCETSQKPSAKNEQEGVRVGWHMVGFKILGGTFQGEFMRAWNEFGWARGVATSAPPGKLAERLASSEKSIVILMGSISLTERATWEWRGLRLMRSSAIRNRPPHCLRPKARTWSPPYFKIVIANYRQNESFLHQMHMDLLLSKTYALHACRKQMKTPIHAFMCLSMFLRL